MIKIQVNKTTHDWIIGFQVSGHSGFDERGRDIVCAAVSTLIQTAIVGIEEVLQVRLHYVNVENFIFLELPENIPARKEVHAQFLMETIYRALLGIQEEYSGYISIEEVFTVKKKNKSYTIIPAESRSHVIPVREKEKRKKGGWGMEDNDFDTFEEEKEGKKKIPWDKLLGVALIGAVSSALLYYLFLQLGDEQKLAIKETIVTQAKQYVAKIAQPKDID